MIVYCITNASNGKKYVGRTSKTLDQRWRAHVLAAKHGSCYKFHLAIRKHGPDAFKVEVLEECVDHESLCSAERRWIGVQFN